MVGGVGGAVVGNAITHGSVAGTILGGVGGALIGHKVGRIRTTANAVSPPGPA